MSGAEINVKISSNADKIMSDLEGMLKATKEFKEFLIDLGIKPPEKETRCKTCSNQPN